MQKDYWKMRPNAPASGTILGSICQIAIGEAQEYVFGAGPSAFRMIVVRWREDIVFGYLNLCPHFSLPLNRSERDFWSPDGKALRCNQHFALFRIEDGLCTSGACDGERLDPVPVKIQNGLLVIDELNAHALETAPE
jgi:nitrite reductase/ring-hydroxylating ferredoxin subunit